MNALEIIEQEIIDVEEWLDELVDEQAELLREQESFDAQLQADRYR